VAYLISAKGAVSYQSATGRIRRGEPGASTQESDCQTSNPESFRGSQFSRWFLNRRQKRIAPSALTLFWGSTNPGALPQVGAECCTFGAKQIRSCFGSQDSGIALRGISVARTFLRVGSCTTQPRRASHSTTKVQLRFKTRAGKNECSMALVRTDLRANWWRALRVAVDGKPKTKQPGRNQES
jgi:hypothetical protein